ncbi:MAG: MerC domain-containing protein [Armatimonadetes bacterium]|nr:MerC domain-containing protein [Armatimonadota bacterium]
MLNFVRTDDAASKIVAPTETLDKAGATASFLCAIHCAVMPFLITVLPLVGLGFLASEPVEWGLLAASGTLGTLSLCVGFREHKRRGVFGILGVALALLVAGRIFHESFHDHPLEVWGIGFMVLGGFTMMGAHVFNRMLCRSCRACSDHGCCN